jgi:hypothetical protein
MGIAFQRPMHLKETSTSRLLDNTSSTANSSPRPFQPSRDAPFLVMSIFCSQSTAHLSLSPRNPLEAPPAPLRPRTLPARTNAPAREHRSPRANAPRHPPLRRGPMHRAPRHDIAGDDCGCPRSGQESGAAKVVAMRATLHRRSSLPDPSQSGHQRQGAGGGVAERRERSPSERPCGPGARRAGSMSGQALVGACR